MVSLQSQAVTSTQHCCCYSGDLPTLRSANPLCLFTFLQPCSVLDLGMDITVEPGCTSVAPTHPLTHTLTCALFLCAPPATMQCVRAWLVHYR